MKHLINKSIILATIMFTSLSFASNKAMQEPVGGEKFGHSVTQVSDGLYVFRWWVYRNFFLVTDEGVIVTDPMNPKASKLLSQEIKKITDKPVKYVAYSHNHHDHISGGQIFKDEGATFIAHSNVLSELKTHPAYKTPLPDITFDDAYTIKLGDCSTT
jgi:glyoxylase-like metal-dependent hydrolase (beta-lactamase superfamily II)